jgi:endonuclease-3
VTSPKRAARKPAAKRTAKKNATRGDQQKRVAKAGTKRAPRKVARGADPERVARIIAGLEQLYPDAHCELDFASPFQLLVATILSAQSTDKTVNTITPALFARFPDAAALAAASLAEVETLVKSSGFFRQKAKNIVGAAQAIVHDHGEVPRSMEALTRLPGVARKTANVVLGSAYHMEEGIAVDTHVTRLSGRLGLSRETDPVKIEQDLLAIFPREKWTQLGHQIIWHGRRLCHARKPKCDECALAPYCPSAGVEGDR